MRLSAKIVTLGVVGLFVTVVVGFVFVAAVVILVFGINSTLDIGKFWDRYFI